MIVRWKNGTLRVEGAQVDARLCLIESGQSFLWHEHEGRFCGVLFGSLLCVEQMPDGLLLSPVNEADIESYLHYFDLARDYGALAAECEMYDCARQAVSMLPGLRILNQPVWETLLSFILSANNHIARITKLVWLLGEHFGETYRLHDLTLHALPTAEVLAEVPERQLRQIGVGYRAPFLMQTARMVRDGFPLESLPLMPYDEAHKLLVRLPGVGDKVADCVLLFSCGHSSAFPVDVWVERLMRAWFPDLRPLSRAKLARCAREMLGANAGLVQQFLFHCARCGLMPLE